MTETSTPAPETALFAAPVLFWLIDCMAPRRILTIGEACEDLHLAMCQLIEEQALNAVCFHVAQGASISFRAARAPHDGVRSRLSHPNGTAPRLGAEGQFDLIVRRIAGTLNAETIAEGRGGLTPGGALALHGTGAPADPGADAALWAVGSESLVLAWTAGAGKDVRLLGAQAEGAYLTLAGLLAADVADRALIAQRKAERRTAEDLRAMQAAHHAELLTLSRKLAEMVEQSVGQRLKLQQSEVQMDQLRDRLAAYEGGSFRRLLNLLARRAARNSG